MIGQEAGPNGLHVIVHAWPHGDLHREPAMLLDSRLQAYRIPPAALSGPMPVTFEQVAEQLATLPRLFIEPDGSFVWVSERGAVDWQIDGQLNDSPAGLMTIELKVFGRHADWPAVLRAVGWPHQPLIYQLVQQGVYLTHQDFEYLAVGQGLP